MPKFKDISPGIFRARNGVCYTKLEQEVSYGEDNAIANAVSISQGLLKRFEETDDVERF